MKKKSKKISNVKKSRFTMYTLFCAAVAALGGILFGFNTSVISGALLFISKDFNLSTISQELVVSVVLIGALTGACVGGLLTDKIGRKFTLIITTIIFFLGTFIIISSHTLTILLIGRLVVGLAIGIASLAVPLYIAEMSDPAHRGVLVSLNQLAITFGILVAYIINYIYAPLGEWRSMFAISLIVVLVMFFALFFIPETPAFLVMTGKEKKALKILKKILIDFKSSEVIVESHKTKHEKTLSWKHLLEKSIRPALIAGIGISVFQQITGVNAIIYYAPKIFQMGGFQTETAAVFASIGIGIINFVMTIFALWLIDNVGRKPLLTVGLIGMLISLFLLGFNFIYQTGFTSMISVISLMCYIAFFAISLGPIAWLIISEIYPMGIRGRAMGIAIFANWTANYLVSLTFLTLINYIGKSLVFWSYGVICFLALIFIIRKIPETKGMNFKQIQMFFKKKV